MATLENRTQGRTVIDDFDPLIAYSDYTQWNTPNPQDNPTWFNLTTAQTGSPWYQGTYHYTTIVGAKASFNFTGYGVTILGSSSPSNTSTTQQANYTISLDSGLVSNPFKQSYIRNLTGNTPQVLYSTTGLYYGNHFVEIENGGGGLLLDGVIGMFEVGANGTTATSTKIDNPDPAFTYTGSWTTNQDPNFYGGSSIYTSTPGDSMSFNVTGSVIWIYGDQVNDHGPFSVYLNDSSTPTATHTGRSGCAGVQGVKYCEKLGGLHFAANDLPMGTHRVKVVNGGTPGNASFFDFDYVQTFVPATYSGRTLITNSTCPFTDCSSATASGTITGSASGTAGTGAATSKASSAEGMNVVFGNGALGLVLGIWLLKVFRG